MAMAKLDFYPYIFPVLSYLIISVLAYGSQFLFAYIEPYDLTIEEFLHFNLIVVFTFVGYTRSWLTDPGNVPPGWQPQNKAHRSRWCRKCEAFKPARAHHCKTCARCIPKMDHHCPWTVNCVSQRTLPHFLRFLVYGVWALVLLEKYLFERIAILWSNRHLPSYLGPSSLAMGCLFTLTLLSSIALFAVGILLIRSLWSLFTNVTSIESWEIERHATIVRRARVLGGYLDGPNGQRIPIVRQEFPYDIGLWSNFVQVFGANPLLWLWPMASTPSNQSGLEFPTNEFEDGDVIWPPPDPDRLPRTRTMPAGGITAGGVHESNKDGDESVPEQSATSRGNTSSVPRRRQFHERYREADTHYELDDSVAPQADGEEAWRNSEGERLADFGLDEEAEFYDGKGNIASS